MVTATTVRVSEYEEKAVSNAVAFAALKSGEWDFATFEAWVSEKTSEAYNRGDTDRGYWDAVCGSVY